MKIKTSELTDAALDWAVAKCEGADVGIISPRWVVKASYSVFNTRRLLCPLEEGGEFYSPSTIWEQGGPIIERENLCVGRKHQADTNYCGVNDPAVDCWARTTAGGYLSYGPTPLIAAMRCYCCSKLGDVVDIPEELCQ